MPYGTVGIRRYAQTTFQAPSIDRLHVHLCLPFGDHDSQIAATLGTGALKYLAIQFCRWAGIRPRRNLQTEPFCQSMMLTVNR
jgi:hypothetical protein